LRRLEQAAAAVGEGQLEARAPEREGPPEVRSLAAAFNETVAKLARLLRSQGEFVTDASHELRTPLTALRLRLESLPPSQDREAALQETDRLRDLVDGLLALARADASGEAPARVDVTAVGRERLEAWRPLADEHGVALVEQLDGPLPVRVAPGRLERVLDNLLSNALDASLAGGSVTLSALAAPPWVELHIGDKGPGLTPEQRERAFDRFWRAGSGGGVARAVDR
jgi:signal transduction histidine kinase